MGFKKTVYKFTLWIQDKLGIKGCVIYPRLFDYTKNKKSSDNWFKDNCPFCHNLETRQFVKRTQYFLITKNRYPYARTQDHLLITPKRHVRSWWDLTTEEVIELQGLISDYLDKGYILLGRQFVKKGFINHASVWHLHIHLILNKK